MTARTRVHAVGIELSVTCPACRRPVPVGGLVEAESCPSCRARVPLGREFWLLWLDRSTLCEVLGLRPESSRTLNMIAEWRAQGSLVHRDPCCPRCERSLSTGSLLADLPQGAHTCACGARLPLRPADELVQATLPGARLLLAESLRGPEDGTGEAVDPVLFGCMGCGGSLSVDGSVRTVPCTYCGASNFLPDALWHRLHPVPTVSTFWVVVEQSRADFLRMRAESPSHVVYAAKARDLPAELAAELVAHEDWEVRQALAANGVVPAELLAPLAKDEDSDVREALASNPSLSAELLGVLARDEDSDVRAIVARHPGVDEALAARLARDTHWKVRQMAVRHAPVAEEVLQRIARKEHDSDVLGALRRREGLSAGVLDLLARRDDRDLQVFAGEHPAVDPQTLLHLATAGHRDARRRAAAHPAAPAEALDQLAEDSDEGVRSALLDRSEPLPPGAAAALGRDPDPGIRGKARMRPEVAAARARRLRVLLLGLGLGAVLLLSLAVAGGVLLVVLKS